MYNLILHAEASGHNKHNGVEHKTSSGGATTAGDPGTENTAHDLVGGGVGDKEEKETRENGNPQLLILKLGDYFVTDSASHLYYVQKKIY